MKTCDILRKPITDDEVHSSFGNYVISKEAVALLPWFLENKQLPNLINGFRASNVAVEMFKKGIWLYAICGYSRFAKYNTVNDAVRYVSEYGKSDAIYTIFQDGEFVKTFVIDTRPIKIIKEAPKPKTLGQLRDEWKDQK